MSQSVPSQRDTPPEQDTPGDALRLTLLDNLLDFSDHGILLACQKDDKMVIKVVNDRLCKTFGIAKAKLANQPLKAWTDHLHDLVNPAETESDFLTHIEVVPTAEEIDEFVLRDERARSFRQRRGPAFGDDGKAFGTLFLYRDITHAKYLEDQALHTQKMESVGTLAGGIAHDFNNILTAILGYGSALKAELATNPEAGEKLEQIIRSAHRAADLTRNLLAFSRKNPHLPQVIDINALARDTTSMLGFAMPEAIRMQVELGERMPSVEADPAQLQQVITHLVINARDAIYGEGNIKISTRIAKDPQANPDSQELRYVVLDVEDDGIGIPKENLARIFEPFYSSKETGQGIGLGLAMVYGTIKQHYGYVEVESAPNMGSRFSIHLPATDATPVELKPFSQEAPLIPATKKGTVLVVDDEQDLRDLCQLALGDICDQVLVAGDGAEGISVYLEHKDDIDLVILDLTMPRMSGQECFEELKKVQRDVKVIIASGYSQEMGPDAMLLEGAMKFLPKPYTINTLTGTVAAALEEIFKDD